MVKWPHGTQKGDLEKAVTSEKSKITSGWSTDLRCQLRAELRSTKGLFTDDYIHLGFPPSSEIIHSRSHNLRSGKHTVNCIGQNRLAFSWAPHVPVSPSDLIVSSDFLLCTPRGDGRGPLYFISSPRDPHGLIPHAHLCLGSDMSHSSPARIIYKQGE